MWNVEGQTPYSPHYAQCSQVLASSEFMSSLGFELYKARNWELWMGWEEICVCICHTDFVTLVTLNLSSSQLVLPSRNGEEPWLRQFRWKDWWWPNPPCWPRVFQLHCHFFEVGFVFRIKHFILFVVRDLFSFCFLRFYFIWVFCLHACLYTTCVQCPWKTEGVRSPGIGVRDGCEPSWGCWELSPGPGEE